MKIIRYILVIFSLFLILYILQNRDLLCLCMHIIPWSMDCHLAFPWWGLEACAQTFYTLQWFCQPLHYSKPALGSCRPSRRFWSTVSAHGGGPSHQPEKRESMLMMTRFQEGYLFSMNIYVFKTLNQISILNIYQKAMEFSHKFQICNAKLDRIYDNKIINIMFNCNAFLNYMQ